MCLLGPIAISAIPLILNAVLRVMNVGGVMLLLAVSALFNTGIFYLLPETMGMPIQDLV